MENLYKQFINTNAESFYLSIIEKASRKAKKYNDVDLEFLNLSYLVLKKARCLEHENIDIWKWRDLAAILRRAAHKIHRKYQNENNHPGFLRLVKES